MGRGVKKILTKPLVHHVFDRRSSSADSDIFASVQQLAEVFNGNLTSEYFRKRQGEFGFLFLCFFVFVQTIEDVEAKIMKMKSGHNAASKQKITCTPRIAV